VSHWGGRSAGLIEAILPLVAAILVTNICVGDEKGNGLSQVPYCVLLSIRAEPMTNDVEDHGQKLEASREFDVDVSVDSIKDYGSTGRLTWDGPWLSKLDYMLSSSITRIAWHISVSTNTRELVKLTCTYWIHLRSLLQEYPYEFSPYSSSI